MNKTDPTDKQVWLHHIEQAKAQALSFAAYAKTHALNVNSLYYWNKIFTRKKSTVKPMQFSAVRVAPVAAVPCVLQLSSHIALQLPTVPDPGWLAELFRQLEPSA